jgi:hypothetical protein
MGRVAMNVRSDESPAPTAPVRGVVLGWVASWSDDRPGVGGGLT